MIRRRIAAHLERRQWHQRLRAAGLTRADVAALEADPRDLDVRLVLAAAQMGVHPHRIADLVLTVQTLKTRIGTMRSLEHIARLHAWGIPYDHAATLVADIARTTEGA